MITKTLGKLEATGSTLSIEDAELPLNHTVVVEITETPTVVIVNLEGAVVSDAVTDDYHVIGTITMDAGELAAGKAMFHVTDKLVRSVRASLATLTGTSIVTIKYVGK